MSSLFRHWCKSTRAKCVGSATLGSLSRYCRRGDQSLMIQTWSVFLLWLSCRTFSDYFSPKSKGGSLCQILHIRVLMSRVCLAKRKPWCIVTLVTCAKAICWSTKPFVFIGCSKQNKTKQNKNLNSLIQQFLLPRMLCSVFWQNIRLVVLFTFYVIINEVNQCTLARTHAHTHTHTHTHTHIHIYI